MPAFKYLLPFTLLFACAACGPVEIDVSVTVERPVSAVWKDFNDDALLKQWLTGLQSIELIEGRDGEVGSKYRMVFDEDGQSFELIETLTEFEPEKSMGFDVYHESMQTRMRYTFTAVEGGTRIEGRNVTEGNGLFWSFMVPLMKSKMIERQQGELEVFKKLVEAERAQ